MVLFTVYPNVSGVKMYLAGCNTLLVVLNCL